MKMAMIGYLCLCSIIFLSTDAGFERNGNKVPDGEQHDDHVSSSEQQPQCDLVIRQGGYKIGDIATGFGGESVYLKCDARCKGPGATPALAWYKKQRKRPIPSTRWRASSYSQSSNRVQRLIIRYFRLQDVGWYTCKGWLGPGLGWVEKRIWLQMGCTHPSISCDTSRCLPEKYRCDGVRHCKDGFDEYECGPGFCNESEFYCDGRCNDIKIRCNAEFDCFDGLDEMNCIEEQKTTWKPDIDYDYDEDNTTETTMTTTAETTTIPTTPSTTIASGCEIDLYPCSDELFIPWDWVCDGMEDCSEGDDEKDCWGSTTDQPTTTPAMETTTPEIEVDCPAEVKSSGHYYDIFNDTCYLFVDEQADWIDADKYCRDMNGDLVQIHSMETMDYIKDRLCSEELGWSNMGVWNGANTLYGDWEWPSGEPLSFSYWADGEPSYTEGRLATEVCAVMKRSEDWQWQDWHCGLLDWKFQFICQFEIAQEDNRTTTSLPSPTTPESCNPATQFECWRSVSDEFRNCIPLPWVCDGRPDCLNNEDEEACTTTTVPSITSMSSSVPTTTESGCASRNRFQCLGGRCIPSVWVCDGMEDCEGGDDEMNCESTTEATEWLTTTEATARPTTTEATEKPTTTETTEQPRTTEATERPTTTAETEQPATTEATEPPTTTEATEPPTTNEATDQSATTEATEPPTSTEATTSEKTVSHSSSEAASYSSTKKHFTTSKAVTTQTQTPKETTSRFTHSKTTRTTTTKKQPECASQFSCGDGTCVSLTQRCDSLPDCADERDELNCPSISCSESNKACKDGQQCIRVSQWGDGVCDCNDRSDEINC